MNEDSGRAFRGDKEDWYRSPARGASAPPADRVPAGRGKRKERRGMSAGAVIALCLVCAVIASAVSSVFTYLIARNGGRSLLGAALEAAAPTPVPVIVTADAGEEGAVNDAAAYIYELAKQQVVGVRTDITYYNIFGQSTAASVSGSGVIITSDGYILTNHHVVENAVEDGLRVTVMLYDETAYDAALVGWDRDNDLALLKIDAAGLNAATLAESEGLTVGQAVYAVGNPLGELSYSMTSGIVSATDRTITTESNVAMNVFQIDAAVNSGNSGGPVYDSQGQVIGIVSAKYSSAGVEGLGFAIPASDAAFIANQLLEYGYVKDKAYLGATSATVTAAIAESYGMVEGAYVQSVEADSAAARAGLQVGDIITALDGQAVTGSGELTSMTRRYRAGDEAVLTVYRGGEELELPVVFDEKPREAESGASAGSSSGRSQYGGGNPFLPGGDMEDFFRYFFGGFGY